MMRGCMLFTAQGLTEYQLLAAAQLVLHLGRMCRVTVASSRMRASSPCDKNVILRKEVSRLMRSRKIAA